MTLKKIRPIHLMAMIGFLCMGLITQNNFVSENVMKKKNGKKIQIECYGGFTLINPADLNQIPVYNEKILNFYYKDRLHFYKSKYGESYQIVNESNNGQFKKIKQAFPLGIRLRYHLSPSLALSIGYKYITGEQTSHVTAHYEIRSTVADQATRYGFNDSRTREISPHTISVTGSAPMVGLHVIPWLNHPVTFEGFLAFGLWTGKCSYIRKRTDEYTDNYDYWHEKVNQYETNGTGKGKVVDMGARLNFEIKKNIGFFLEGVYSYQIATDLKGSGKIENWNTDVNSPEVYDLEISWQGCWGMSEIDTIRDWGHLQTKYPTSYWEKKDAAVRNFQLDLSGFQIRIGIFLKL